MIDIDMILDTSDYYLNGKKDKIKLALCAIFSGGHVLIEDLPGVGKTTLVKLLGKIFNLKVSRIQFTNDILPNDIIGTSVFNRETHQFQFHPGPIFGEIILADELNRAPPKTQSALLQSMEEKHVTIDGESYELPPTFIVFATQNPNGQIGTFDLPESQLDRFCYKFNIGYPEKSSSLKMLKNMEFEKELDSLEHLISSESILTIRKQVKLIKMDDSLYDYIHELLSYSRNNSEYIPLSNRCGIDLVKASKTMAYLNKRDYVIPEDIQFIFPYVAGHRLVHPSQSSIEKETEVSKTILNEVSLR